MEGALEPSWERRGLLGCRGRPCEVREKWEWGEEDAVGEQTQAGIASYGSLAQDPS